MSSILIHNARILTLAEGSTPRRGAMARNLSVIDRGYIWADGERLTCGHGDPPADATAPTEIRCAPTDLGSPPTHTIIDAQGRIVMPAFVDAHTHACWAGDRLDEWDMKRRGVSYLDILNAGGGIMSTVRAVREASLDELTRSLGERLRRMRHEGTTTCEVKSGYGLNTDTELKMLAAIREAQRDGATHIVPTALIGHAIDPTRSDFVDYTIDDTLPAVSEAFSGITIDAYCENGAWTVDCCRRLFEKAILLGHPFRVHADQFNALGMTPLAVEMGARSVDHLEASTVADLTTLAESDTFGVMIPATGFHLDDRYANGRLFLDMGGALVIASNDNPGSAPCSSMPFVISLAVRKLGLTIEEAITACTINAAALLGPLDTDPRGHTNTPGFLHSGPSDSIGHRFIMLRHTDERLLAYEFGGDPVELIVSDGRILKWTGDDAMRTIIHP